MPKHLLRYQRDELSEVCEKHGVQPTLLYIWQKKLFEEGAAVFEQPRARSPRQQAAEQRRIEALEGPDPEQGRGPGRADERARRTKKSLGES